ncbi:hypothetical protein FHS23_000994 [Prauserella isguenensis]|uniref:Peptidoglycan-binding protein n=1 Tax=Prauserella isguenensis TaxID=1470180 RepID=A0A839RZJ7_9PSEU|nr:peptidoglycan-binding protein [Prauserella isguenensis]MBB3049999.1 hypothetical protein [Prauserella isguenensis]
MTAKRPASTALTGLAAAAMVAALPMCAAADTTVGSGAASGAAAAAKVNMAAVLKAAQIDPQRPDQTLTDGAAKHVRKVERELAERGVLEQRYVDGHYGTATLDAYSAFQRSLGYEGLAANGIPGERSLTALGDGAFDVTDVVRPGKRVKLDGATFNQRTKAMLLEAQRLTDVTFDVEQGSYNPGGDPTSAGTHDGGGAVDLYVDGMSPGKRTEVVRAMRKVGFAAWHRTPAQGDWGPHIHAVALADPDQSEPARAQTGDYYLGKNGLANDRPDDGPEVKPIRTWEGYQRTQ